MNNTKSRLQIWTLIIFIENTINKNTINKNFNFFCLYFANPFVYATEFRMRHRVRNNAHNGMLLNPNPLSVELQYNEWQKVIVAISLIENRSCTDSIPWGGRESTLPYTENDQRTSFRN